MFCINCGKEIQEKYEYCPECGTKISNQDNGIYETKNNQM